LVVVLVVITIPSLQFADCKSDDFDSWVDGGFSTGPKIFVNVNNITSYCGEEITITVGKIRTFEEFLCEGDERPLEEQRADPIVAEGFEVRLPKGKVQERELIEVCVKVVDDRKCEVTTYTSDNNPPEILFNLS